MAGRRFQHYDVTFTRTVEQRQTVNVAVDAALAGTLGEEIAQQLAPSRLKDSRWASTNIGPQNLANVEVAQDE